MLDEKSDTIGVQDFIWSDRRNLSEIMNEKAGYHIFYLGIGGRNSINYNNFDSKQIGIYKDGVQINDNFFGGFDQENISVNEIQKIEVVSNISSFLYGLNTSGKALNIITKDAFQPTIFSQLRYSQDRYGALFADFSLNIPFSKKFNFIFGINSHFTDGYYKNSDFNVWRGRFKFNYYASPNFNLKASFYNDVINRRLNGGLKFNTEDTLRNQNFAEVNFNGMYERLRNYNFDLTATARIFRDKTALTRFIFYINNYSRIFRDDEYNNPAIAQLNADYHYLQYGFGLRQNFKKRFFNIIDADLLIGGNAFINYYNFPDSLYIYSNNVPNNKYTRENLYTGFYKIDFSLDKLFLSHSFKDVLYDGKLYYQYGFEGNYTFLNDNDYMFKLISGFNSTFNEVDYNYLLWYDYHITNYFYWQRKQYFEIGFEAKYKDLTLDAYNYYWSYYNWYSSEYEKFSLSNWNYSIKYNSKLIDMGFSVGHSTNYNIPSYIIKSDIVYHNFFFKNKLDLKLGLSGKYFTKSLLFGFNNYRYSDNVTYSYDFYKDFFNIDFYIGARIGTANINLTLANILDRFNYSKAIYPYDTRGGFLNSISRFTIVWDFNR